jgi:hypothetical protein
MELNGIFFDLFFSEKEDKTILLVILFFGVHQLAGAEVTWPSRP